MRHLLTILIAALAGLGAGPLADGAEARPLILAHVMPWFEAKQPNGAGAWGWHWTMNHFNPDQIAGDKRRQIAAHAYPAIGPYDSIDPNVLEYQTLLMKAAGIDGAIIDWYGLDDVNDFAGIHRRTLALIAALKRHGLKFAICYEDRVIREVAKRSQLTPDQATARVTAHLRFCAEHWFTDPAYVTWQGQPLLMVFGPDFLKADQWEQTLGRLKPRPAFFTLHERRAPAIGSFAWPPMWASQAGKLSTADLTAYLDRFARQDGAKIPCAFPGFQDIYAEAGNRPSYGFLDARAGATFRLTLDRALKLGSPIIQVATWNDYGEGTEIEPTRESGAKYLAMIQDARRKLDGPAFPYSAADLDLPARFHFDRSSKSIQAKERPHLDAAVKFFDAGDTEQARAELAQVHISTVVEPIRPSSSLRSR